MKLDIFIIRDKDGNDVNRRLSKSEYSDYLTLGQIQMIDAVKVMIKYWDTNILVLIDNIERERKSKVPNIINLTQFYEQFARSIRLHDLETVYYGHKVIVPLEDRPLWQKVFKSRTKLVDELIEWNRKREYPINEDYPYVIIGYYLDELFSKAVRYAIRTIGQKLISGKSKWEVRY